MGFLGLDWCPINQKILFWPKNAKTGNRTHGELLLQKNWCGQFWSFWVLNSTFWLIGQIIIFSTSMIIWTFLCVSRHYVHKYLNYAYEHYIQNCVTWQQRYFGFVQKKLSFCFMLKTNKVHKYLLLGNSWLHSESFFYMLNCENKKMWHIFFNMTIRKLLSICFFWLP